MVHNQRIRGVLAKPLLSICLAFSTVVWGAGTASPRDPCLAWTDEKQPASPSLTVSNSSREVVTLSPTDFGKLPRQTLRVKDHLGALAAYRGAALADVLRVGKVTLGKDLKGPLLAYFLLIEAADGYRVVFSLPEVDPDMTDNPVVIADEKDGKPLDANEGPYRLIVPHDKKHARWVRQVTRISVRAAEVDGGAKSK
jgi:hypothetical protein